MFFIFRRQSKNKRVRHIRLELPCGICSHSINLKWLLTTGMQLATCTCATSACLVGLGYMYCCALKTLPLRLTRLTTMQDLPLGSSSHFQTQNTQNGLMKQKLLLGTLQHVAHVGATCARRPIKCKPRNYKATSMWHGHHDIQSSEAASSSTAPGRSANEQRLIAEGETALDLSLDLGLDPYLRLDRETEMSLLRAVEQDFSMVEQDFSMVTGTVSQKHSNSSTSDYVPADVPDDTPNGPDASTIQRTSPDYWDTFTRPPPPTPGRNLYKNTSRCTSVSPIEFDVDIARASTGPTASVDPRQPFITDLADACASLLDVKVREQELILRRSMEASSDSESLIREWDRAQGLRFCHSKTTLATSRSRKNFVNTVFENEHEIPKKRGRPRKKKSNCTKESARGVICGISHAITSTFCPSGGSVSSPSDATPPRRVSESSEAA